MTRLTLSDCFNTSYRDSFAVSQPLTRDPANKQRDDELLYRCEPSYRRGISRSR
ncbi:hypothetical protein [Wolbachia endosymbiont (group A) of Gymnosoma rotundatum]|uniref:hypothetical protein n=1 Tax=Wolbachia endosymbiont (group A) of Gymnosoma rotundatum TaxID=2954016 RepID=UPI0022260436|nr:hypothetical protein [Wolbachia endosymbiont (group A) of Gymnosoma rotundatum]